MSSRKSPRKASRKSSRKVSIKTSKKSPRKALRKSPRKASRKTSRKASRKTSKKASRKASPRKVSRKASKKSTRKVSRKASRKTSRKSPRKSPRKASRKSSKKASKKSARKASKKSARKVSRKSPRKVSRKSARKVSPRKASRKSPRKASKKASRKASKKASKKASRKSPRKASKKALRKSSRKSLRKSSRKSLRKSSRKSSKKTSKETIETKHFNKNNFVAMLANKYNGQEPSNYYISEKLDGIRAIYDGKSDSFISRNNKPLIAPKFFTEKFPNLVLDGELYTKRKDFAGTGIFRKKVPIDSEWKKAVYMVFDLPLVNLPFEERYALMTSLLKGIPYLKVVKHIKVKDTDHMNEFHKKIVLEGAEGSMIRHKDSFYENKRSNNLLKIKDFFDDEVIVIGHEMGEGRNENVLGALHVKWLKPKMGTNEFKVGSGFNDVERKNWKKLYPNGTIITIKYWEIDKHSKRPRFPIFMNIRHNE